MLNMVPDSCCESIDFEVDDYTAMVVTSLPTYSGATTVTPSEQTQTLETRNTALHADITVNPIPYEDVEAATPVITVDNSGKVTATTAQAGGIVESSTKTAEYQQTIVARAKPTVTVDNTGKITAATSQAGGFVQAGTETTELQQETVAQATPSITVDGTGVITASATQAAGFVDAGTKSATLAQQTVEQATPTISVAANGNVTASATQTGGFVLAGTKSAAYSLPTQAATAITPTESVQTAVAAGKWTTGAVQVDAIPSDYVKPSGTYSIASNGTYNVGQYASASVNVPGITPTGTLEIKNNGTYDVTNYASANVDVAGGKTYPFINDGKTYFYIDVFSDAVKTVPFAFGQTVANGVVVDWGDGSAPETFSETAVTNHTHTYADQGEYTITLDVTSGSVLYGGSNAATVFAYGTALNSGTTTTALLLRAVEIGSRGASAQTLGSNAFAYHYNIVSVALSDAITHLADRVFINCVDLSHIRLPNALVSFGDYAISSNNVLSELVLPDTVQTMGVVITCPNLKRLHLPNNANYSASSRIATHMFSLQTLDVPASVTNIVAYGFTNNTGMLEYHFHSTTPPTLANTNAFSGMRSDCVIYVPQESVEAYKTAANWSSLASHIVGE